MQKERTFFSLGTAVGLAAVVGLGVDGIVEAAGKQLYLKLLLESAYMSV